MVRWESYVAECSSPTLMLIDAWMRIELSKKIDGPVRPASRKRRPIKLSQPRANKVKTSLEANQGRVSRGRIEGQVYCIGFQRNVFCYYYISVLFSVLVHYRISHVYFFLVDVKLSCLIEVTAILYLYECSFCKFSQVQKMHRASR